MKEALLIGTAAAVYFFGCHVMKKLDLFLEQNRRMLFRSSEMPGYYPGLGTTDPAAPGIGETGTDCGERFCQIPQKDRAAG